MILTTECDAAVDPIKKYSHCSANGRGGMPGMI